MSKAIRRLRGVLETIGPRRHGTEGDFEGNIHIIFGEICGIAIVQDVGTHYYMVFLSEDDGLWYISEGPNYADIHWVTDYANVIERATKYCKENYENQKYY